MAQNIALALAGRSPKPFSFKTVGQLATIGRRTGVAQILGFNFSGFFAWWLWRTIYLSKLPGFDKKVRVAFDWTLDLLFRKDVCAVHDLPPRANSYPQGLKPDWKGRKASSSVIFSSPEVLSEFK